MLNLAEMTTMTRRRVKRSRSTTCLTSRSPTIFHSDSSSGTIRHISIVVGVLACFVSPELEQPLQSPHQQLIYWLFFGSSCAVYVHLSAAFFFFLSCTYSHHQSPCYSYPFFLSLLRPPFSRLRVSLSVFVIFFSPWR